MNLNIIILVVATAGVFGLDFILCGILHKLATHHSCSTAVYVLIEAQYLMDARSLQQQTYHIC